MKILLEEYGKVILYFIVGIAVLGSIIGGIRWWYQSYYPSLQQSSAITVTVTEEQPILVVDNIEIPVQESMSEIDYGSYAIAYEEHNQEAYLDVEVYGTDKVDVTTQGIYELIYVTTSSTGQTFSKKISVLIY